MRLSTAAGRLSTLLCLVAGGQSGVLYPREQATPPTLVARQVEVPLANYFRRRALHSIAILDDRLYIEGGEISQFVNGIPDPGPNYSRPVNTTVSLPLATAWTNATVQLTAISQHPNPSLKNFALWTDPATKTLVSWGGDGPYGNVSGARNKTAWVFKPDGSGGGAWTTRGPANPEAFLGVTRNTQGAQAVCRGKGYYLGGWAGPATDSNLRRIVPTPGMLVYDLASGGWTNETAPAIMQTIQEGEALCAPFGGGGVLAVVGGLYSSPTDYLAVRQVAMNEVNIYDPDKKEWHTQATTGDIPDQRSWFCAAGVQGKNGTYEIFIYGGYNNIEILSDLYVLSLPGFRWFRVPVTGTPRHIHKCIAARGRQMLVVGGLGDGWSNWSQDQTDPWSQGLGILDMTTLSWSDRYDPNSPPYESAQVVKDWYNGGGLASVSWTSDAVKTLFVNGASAAPPDGNNKTDPNNTSGSGSPTNTGAIIGGVLGGLAVLSLAAIAFFWHRRRRNLRAAELDAAQAAAPHSHYRPPAAGQAYGWDGQEPKVGAAVNQAPAELDPDASPPAELPHHPVPQEMPHETRRLEMPG